MIEVLVDCVEWTFVRANNDLVGLWTDEWSNDTAKTNIFRYLATLGNSVVVTYVQREVVIRICTLIATKNKNAVTIYLSGKQLLSW